MELEKEIQVAKFNSQVQKAVIHILFTAHWLKTKINSHLKPFGLTQEQFNVMRILKGKHPARMCVKNIGQRMIEKNSNVPRILDRLVAKGLVERQQSLEDRRETESQLTVKGLELLQKVNAYLDDSQNKLIELTEETAGELNRLLEEVRKS